MSYRMSRVVLGFLLVCSLVCLMSVDAQAQAPTSSQQKTNNANSNANSNSEEAAIFERILNRAHFENDGTEVSETEAVVRIQSQAGVEEFGQMVFGYSSATEKLEVDEYPNTIWPNSSTPAWLWIRTTASVSLTSVPSFSKWARFKIRSKIAASSELELALELALFVFCWDEVGACA